MRAGIGSCFRLPFIPMDLRPLDFIEVATFRARHLEDALIGLGIELADRTMVKDRGRTGQNLPVAEGERSHRRQFDRIALLAHLEPVDFIHDQHLRDMAAQIARGFRGDQLQRSTGKLPAEESRAARFVVLGSEKAAQGRTGFKRAFDVGDGIIPTVVLRRQDGEDVRGRVRDERGDRSGEKRRPADAGRLDDADFRDGRIVNRIADAALILEQANAARKRRNGLRQIDVRLDPISQGDLRRRAKRSEGGATDKRNRIFGHDRSSPASVSRVARISASISAMS